MQDYLVKFVSDSGRSVVFPGTPVPFIYKTDRHDIAEVLLKVALDTTTLIITRKPIIVMRTCFCQIISLLSNSFISTTQALNVTIRNISELVIFLNDSSHLIWMQ